MHCALTRLRNAFLDADALVFSFLVHSVICKFILFSEALGFPSKLASLLKPKLNMDRNASPSLKVPSRGDAGRSPSPSHKPSMKMAALFNKMKAHDVSADNADTSPNSSQLSGQHVDSVDHNNNPEKAVPSVAPAAKFLGMFKKKPDENKGSTADKQTQPVAKGDNSADDSMKASSPAAKLAILKAHASPDISVQQDSIRATNQTPTNQGKPSSPSQKTKVSPKLAAILKPRYKSSLGEAASLGQFLELKMRGGKFKVLSSAKLSLDLCLCDNLPPPTSEGIIINVVSCHPTHSGPMSFTDVLLSTVSCRTKLCQKHQILHRPQK